MPRQLAEAADEGVDRVNGAAADQLLDAVAELLELEREGDLAGELRRHA